MPWRGPPIFIMGDPFRVMSLERYPPTGWHPASRGTTVGKSLRDFQKRAHSESVGESFRHSDKTFGNCYMASQRGGRRSKSSPAYQKKQEVIPFRFLTDNTNSISNCKIPASVGADPCVCPFPGRTHGCAPTKVMLLL